MRFWTRTLILIASLTLGSGGHAATRLSGTLVEGGDVALFEIAPDGSHVVYQADQEVDGLSELYSLRLDDEPEPLKISGDVANAGVTSAFGRFQISRDSTWTVFRANTTPDGNTIDLLSVPLDGSAPPIDLNGPLFGPLGSFPSDGDFKIAPDSRRVVFSGDPGHSAFSTRIDGSGPKVMLDAPDRWIARHQISPDGQRLVWRDWRDQGVHAQALDGSTPPVRLDDATGNVITAGFPSTPFTISPNGDRIVFTVVEGDGPNTQRMHYSTLLDGSGTPVKLNGDLLQSGNMPQPINPGYQLSANGEYLVFRFDESSDGRTELFARPVDASGPARLLTSPDAVGLGVSFGSFYVSPHNQHVVFLDRETEGARDLFANTLAGDTLPWKLNDPITDGYLAHVAFTPDGSRVVYHNVVDEPVAGGLRRQPTVLSVHAASVDGITGPVELISDPTGPAVIWDSQIAPDGSFVVFSVDRDGFFYGLNEFDFPETHVLYTVPITGGVAQPVTELLGNGRRIVDFQITPDSRSIIYLANQEDASVFELFSVPAAVPEPALAGDYNGDGLIEQADLDLVLANWGASTITPTTSWTNNLPTGAVDQEELDKVLFNWGETRTTDFHAVPEPSGIILGLLALIWGLVSSKRSEASRA